MKSHIDGEYKVTELDNGIIIREINQEGKTLPPVKTNIEKAKEILAGVTVSELDKSDIGLAMKALLTERGLI